MIAIDTNILVYSHRRGVEWHERARAAMFDLMKGAARWAIPWPCIHEFLATVTNRRRFGDPTPVAKAQRQVEVWMESPYIVLSSESPGYWEHFRKLLASSLAHETMTHDARIAAICSLHGITEFWTADRDFSRFPNLRARNPLIG